VTFYNQVKFMTSREKKIKKNIKQKKLEKKKLLIYNMNMGISLTSLSWNNNSSYRSHYEAHS
jgi:hypothetical protein